MVGVTYLCWVMGEGEVGTRHQLLQLFLESVEVHLVPLDRAGRHGQHHTWWQSEGRARHAHLCKNTQQCYLGTPDSTLTGRGWSSG